MHERNEDRCGFLEEPLGGSGESSSVEAGVPEGRRDLVQRRLLDPRCATEGLCHAAQLIAEGVGIGDPVDADLQDLRTGPAVPRTDEVVRAVRARALGREELSYEGRERLLIGGTLGLRDGDKQMHR